MEWRLMNVPSLQPTISSSKCRLGVIRGSRYVSGRSLDWLANDRSSDDPD
jgi:hypothetical protein